MLEYLLSEYKIRQWPTFLINKLKYEGHFNQKEFDKLLAEGKIRVREGMHGDLIELIIKDVPEVHWNKSL
jgi:hypothetical protein